MGVFTMARTKKDEGSAVVAEVMSGSELNRAGQEVTAYDASSAGVAALAMYGSEPTLALRVAPPLMAAVGVPVRGVVAGSYQAEHSEFGAYGVCVYEVRVGDQVGLFAIHAVPETIRGTYRALKPQRGDKHTILYSGLRQNKAGTREYHDYTIVDASDVTVDTEVTW